MAKDLYDTVGEVKQAYKKAAEILGFDLADICFNGPEEELKQTRVTQPAIFVHSAVLTELLRKKDFLPDMAAGHSLGEYSALFAAEALNFEDALRLVKYRAELMQRAGENQPGTMAAIIGLESDSVKAICEQASSAGIVQVANYNSQIQVVISGSLSGVDRAMEIAKENGAKRVVPLVVGGAFHSPLMDFATHGLAKALEETEIQKARIPVYSNVHSKPVIEPAEIRTLLEQQLTSPVQWLNIMRNMIADGGSQFYEVGPGTVLKGLVRRADGEVSAESIQGLEALEKLDKQ